MRNLPELPKKLLYNIGLRLDLYYIVLMEESLVDLYFIKIYKLLWRKHMSKKYILCSGYVVSRFDNKEHYVNG